MFRLPTQWAAGVLLWCAWFAVWGPSARGQEKPIPESLKEWVDWAMWDQPHQNCPTPYHDPAQHICFWPGKLTLQAEPVRATWTLEVTVYETTWVPLPGTQEHWPQKVQADGAAIAVLEREGIPHVQLAPGKHLVEGTFQWDKMPQRLAVPSQIGVLSLSVGGSPVPIPTWDADGGVWLQRLRAEGTDQDSITAQVYRVLEDGIPLWLRTKIELTVSGKSREEDLGSVLPEGWKLSLVDSPIPVAVDDTGRMKAQVRAGKWIISVDAFRTTDPGQIRYAEGVQPMVSDELVGFRANPEIRMAEITDIPTLDVTQTTFPDEWRSLPVYQWPTNSAFRLVEKMRGMGQQTPQGLTINRQFWLDDDGNGITFRDHIQGSMQQIWRLDVAGGQELGAARVDGNPQLITTNPATDAQGFEIRSRNLNLDAVGRIASTEQIPATGWQSNADSLQISLMLPPGWRVLALFGADRVEGDWLTAWTLLDLFLLLVFSLAVFRIWGFAAGIIAFLAFGLAYHEPNSARFSWLFLLIPVAILRVVHQDGFVRRALTAWKYLALAILAVLLVPFIAMQVQSVIYPQLEPAGFRYGASRFAFLAPGAQVADRTASTGNDVMYEQTYAPAAPMDGAVQMEQGSAQTSANVQKGAVMAGRFSTANLAYDANAKIQTGPAEPDWRWNQVDCSWNGPVSADQQIRPILISLGMHRVLTLVRIALLLVLAAVLLGANHSLRGLFRRAAPPKTATVATLLALTLLGFGHRTAVAQVPDAEVLEQLRQRLTKPSDAFPNAAQIQSASLKVIDGKITLRAEVHAAVDVAVPMPGRLPAWSPVTVRFDGKSSDGETPSAVVVRREGYLWVWVPQGVHTVVVEGLLPEVAEWEWTYLLKPRYVSIDAPDWNVTGVQPTGVPEQQVFFVRKQQAVEGEAAYDRKEFQAIAQVDRQLEMGLVWKVTTRVRRLSTTGKALSLRIPLLTGESVLRPDAQVRDGQIDVRLGAQEELYEWSSELPVGANLTLTAPSTEQWVERWQLVTSPIWNVTPSGLAPIFEAQEQNLVPVWHPWPGETVNLAFSKPTPVAGETVTVQRVNQTVELGSRQKNTTLKLELESSLGGDFLIGMAPDAEILSLTLDGQTLRVRRDDANLVVPAKPGKQNVEVQWRTYETLGTRASAGSVTLPIPSANITSVITVPESRWILWAEGPRMGPAVRFWVILACAVIAAFVLGGLKFSPLSRWQWILLVIGLTQVHVVSALIVVAWFFLVAWRGKQADETVAEWRFNFRQLVLVFHTIVMLIILIFVVGAGLLGNPEMFVLGNGSYENFLQWYQSRSDVQLPEPSIISISVWYYRGLMLAWALWLASAVIGWLKWAWEQFTAGGSWRTSPKVVSAKVVEPPKA